MSTEKPLPDRSPHGGALPAPRRLLVLLTAVAAVLFAFFCTPLGAFVQDREAIEALALTARRGDFGAISGFIAVSSLMIMIGTPRLIFFTFGSFAFGFGPGLLYSLAGCLTGSFLAFAFARWGARDWLQERFGGNRYVRKIVAAEPKMLTIALFRFLPISNALVNLGLALSHTGLRAFFVGSLLGYLPQGVLAALIGSGLAENAPWQAHLQWGVAGVLGVTLLFVGARLRHRRS